MEEHKKKILILVGAIMIAIILLAIILGIVFKEDNENKPSADPGNVENKNIISKEIEELKSDELFFALQNTINSYYNMLSNKKTDDLLKILDDDFRKEKQITSSNLYSIINSEYETVSFIAKSIYYNPNSSITYYFVNGYLTNLTMMEDDYQYYPNINFLIVVDEKTNYFCIKPLDNSINVSDYSKSYDIKEKKITNEYLLSSYTISEKNKLSVYITEFLDLMVYDNNRAYSMLDEITKKKYQNRVDFENNLFYIYNNISTIIFGYSVKENNGEKVYSITDDYQNKITIYEKNTMNYKISY